MSNEVFHSLPNKRSDYSMIGIKSSLDGQSPHDSIGSYESVIDDRQSGQFSDESNPLGIMVLDDMFDDWDVKNCTNLEVQSSMSKPYLLLEFASSLVLNICLCSNAFTLILIATDRNGVEHTDNLVRYIIIKMINLVFVGLVSFVFTTPDTFKSVNVTIEYLAINIIVYDYEFSHIIKYLGIHLMTAVVGCLFSIGMFYEYINHLPTEQILPNIIVSSFSFTFNYSFILISFVVHLGIASGLTVVSNHSNSTNAKKKTLYKAAIFMFASVAFGSVIGPIGYMFPQLLLYSMIILIRGDFDLFNASLFISYIVTIISVIVLYPIIAIQIKFFWRNRYRRYIEYDTLA